MRHFQCVGVVKHDRPATVSHGITWHFRFLAAHATHVVVPPLSQLTADFVDIEADAEFTSVDKGSVVNFPERHFHGFSGRLLLCPHIVVFAANAEFVLQSNFLLEKPLVLCFLTLQLQNEVPFDTRWDKSIRHATSGFAHLCSLRQIDSEDHLGDDPRLHVRELTQIAPRTLVAEGRPYGGFATSRPRRRQRNRNVNEVLGHECAREHSRNVTSHDQDGRRDRHRHHGQHATIHPVPPHVLEALLRVDHAPPVGP